MNWRDIDWSFIITLILWCAIAFVMAVLAIWLFKGQGWIR